MIEEYGKVLAALHANDLTCDPAKTKVGLQTVKFFGIAFSPKGMKPDLVKAEAVKFQAAHISRFPQFMGLHVQMEQYFP